ncbi:hyalin-like [Asterias amurensis]|uniref:hyalin-like n=1 Tax=Asterias amurensis TaxID=7602 RepID=UPI003AB38771
MFVESCLRSWCAFFSLSVCIWSAASGADPVFDAAPCVEEVNVQPDANKNVARAFWIFPTATDENGNPAAVSCDQPNGGIFNGGMTTVTCTATDLTDQTATCSFDVKVYPTFSTGCPNNIILETEDTLDFDTPIAVGSDNTNPEVTCKPPTGSTFTDLATEVTCTAMDSLLIDQQVSCVFTVSVGSIPTFNTPGSCDATGIINVQPDTGKNTASGITWTEPASTDSTVSCEPDPDTAAFPGGVTNVTCTATNDVTPTLFSTCEFAVHVYPTFDAEGCPDDDIMEIAGTNSFVAPTANADSDGTLAVVTCDPVSGSNFANPSTVVTCTATDSVLTDQEASCSFTISVGAKPVFNAPCVGPIIIDVSPNDGKTTASGFTWDKPSATGATVSCEPDPDSAIFQGGETSVTCAATNDITPTLIETCELTVRVFPAFEDNKCVSDLIRQQGVGGISAKVAWLLPKATLKNGDPASVACIPESGSSFSSLETDVVCTASEAPDVDVSTCSFKVSIHSLAPNFTDGCPNDVSIDVTSTGSNMAAHIWDMPEATNDYTPQEQIKVLCVPANNSTFLFGETTVLCFAIDSRGNTASCDFTISVEGTVECTPECNATSMCTLSNKGESECICNEGYTLSDNQCTNKDECKVDQPCHAMADCLDLEPPEMFNCSCKEGYFGDGMYSCSSAPVVFPDLDSTENFEKVFNVEIAIADSSVSACEPYVDTQTVECIALVRTFIIQVTPLYQQVSVDSFIRIDVNQTSIRNGSVIIPHNVIYNFSKEDIRGMSADEFYDKSIKAAVESGRMGSLAVVVNCTSCQDPKDHTDVCAAAKCAEGYSLVNDNTIGKCIPTCVSVCTSNSEYCNEGTCTHEVGKPVLCSNCPAETTGETCEPIPQQDLALIIGLSVGLGVPALCIIIGIIAYCVYSKGKKAKVNMSGDGGSSNDDMAMENAGVAT